MTGRLHSIQSLGAVDGPGIRAVAFLQGCPLRCAYCHNPDTWEIEAAALAKRLLRYRPYWGKEGGVTVTGGEPLRQADFVAELFSILQAEGVHTALDTSCTGDLAAAERVLAHTNLVLADLKFLSEEDYRRYCRGSLSQTVDPACRCAGPHRRRGAHPRARGKSGLIRESSEDRAASLPQALPRKISNHGNSLPARSRVGDGRSPLPGACRAAAAEVQKRVSPRRAQAAYFPEASGTQPAKSVLPAGTALLPRAASESCGRRSADADRQRRTPFSCGKSSVNCGK